MHVPYFSSRDTVRWDMKCKSGRARVAAMGLLTSLWLMGGNMLQLNRFWTSHWMSFHRSRLPRFWASEQSLHEHKKCWKVMSLRWGPEQCRRTVHWRTARTATMLSRTTGSVRSISLPTVSNRRLLWANLGRGESSSTAWPKKKVQRATNN